MTLYRYALSAVALAACQLVAAQNPAPPPAPLAPDSSTEPRLIRGNDRVIAPAKASAAFDGPPISFNFEEAPVAEVVRTILGDILKADYVLHPPLSGTITLATRAAVAPDQAAFLLESALQANGLALLRDARGSYHVGRPDTLKTIGTGVRQTGSGPLPPGYGAIVVPLQYIGAAEMATILRPLMPAEALVRVDNVRNLLVLTGTRTQAEGWLDLVNTFDVDLLKGMSVGVFPLKYASIKEVEAAMQLMGGGGGAAAQASAPGAAGRVGAAAGAGGVAALAEANPLFGALRIMPIERLNSILVVTPRAAYLDEARRWIERLDQPSDNSAEPQLFIYQVQNVNARHLATVLGGIFGDGRQGGAVANSGVAPGLTSATGSSLGQPVNAFGANTAFPSAGGLGIRAGGIGATGALGTRAGQTGTAQQAPATATLGNVRVMADELNNSVLVWSTKSEYAKIESTLKRLDLPPTQVLIEASIVEVTLNDDLQYGLQWAFSDSRSTTGYTGVGLLSNNTQTSGSLLAPTNGFSYTLKNPLGNVRAILTALSAKTTLKVIASPSLMVLDNHTASIAVGNQTPIQAGTTQNIENNVTSTNIQYKDTGVNLMVTPSVNAGNIVTMQVDQSVTDVGGQDEITKQRSFLQRQLSSKVAVRSGESIVMGGLIQETGTNSRSGLPGLHDVPVLGNLFGSTRNEGRRTELLVVITPRVVRSDVEISEVSADLRDRMRGLQRLPLDNA
ncbi:MAG: type II secretion system secretin GspD, partial [Simplicispira sp.]|nr:type II secretion system secretin GspD [Simplicispira sp.]